MSTTRDLGWQYSFEFYSTLLYLLEPTY